MVQLAGQFAHEPAFKKPHVAGEICFLCTSLDAPAAIAPLITLVSRDDAADISVADGEDLRLRALVGLLGYHQDLRYNPGFAAALEPLLRSPKYKILSLTALVGLWPERRSELTKLASLSPDEESSLELSLEWSGFRREQSGAQVTGRSGAA